MAYTVPLTRMQKILEESRTPLDSPLEFGTFALKLLFKFGNRII